LDDLFDRVLLDPLAQLTMRGMVERALEQFHAFTLVMVRMSGLMVIGPLFGQSIVPGNVRVFLVLTLSLLITPALQDHSRVAFERFDTNRSGRLIKAEVPPHLHERFDELQVRTGRMGDSGLTQEEWLLPPRIPSSVFDYAWTGIGEFALGAVLGLGVFIVLSGLQLAGQLLDQQAGIALGEVFSPGLDISGSVSGQLFYLLGVTVFLIMEPIGGHLLMISALVETFQTLPVGEAFVSVSAIDYLRDLVHLSLVLAVQVAAPMLAIMSLIALTMGFLGHTIPQINVLVVGFPIRALANMLILLLTLSGAARLVVDLVPVVIDDLRGILTGYG
jgi:flagellar biosynthetic protein FliR